MPSFSLRKLCGSCFGSDQRSDHQGPSDPLLRLLASPSGRALLQRELDARRDEQADGKEAGGGGGGGAVLFLEQCHLLQRQLLREAVLDVEEALLPPVAPAAGPSGREAAGSEGRGPWQRELRRLCAVYLADDAPLPLPGAKRRARRKLLRFVGRRLDMPGEPQDQDPPTKGCRTRGLHAVATVAPIGDAGVPSLVAGSVSDAGSCAGDWWQAENGDEQWERTPSPSASSVSAPDGGPPLLDLLDRREAREAPPAERERRQARRAVALLGALNRQVLARLRAREFAGVLPS